MYHNKLTVLNTMLVQFVSSELEPNLISFETNIVNMSEDATFVVRGINTILKLAQYQEIEKYPFRGRMYTFLLTAVINVQTHNRENLKNRVQHISILAHQYSVLFKNNCNCISNVIFFIVRVFFNYNVKYFYCK